MNVVVTEPEYKKAEQVFQSTTEMSCFPVPQEEELLAESIVRLEAKHAIVGTRSYTGALYDALPEGGVIARFGVAHDGINKIKVREAQLYCTNTPGVLSNSVAELTICFLLMAARPVLNMTNCMKQGQWSPQIGFELSGKKLAVIGCGAIGKRVSQIASSGFHMKTIGYDICELDVEQMKHEYGFDLIVTEFTDAVSDADFITFHISLTESTQRYVDAEKLNWMPKHAWLINTSRGGILDEKALFTALKSGTLAGAALDVFDKEPYVPITPEFDLRTLENVILTPHTGTTTIEASRRMAERCLLNLRYAENGEFGKMDLIARPE